LATAKPLRGVLFTFDVDGTLWTSNGPVSKETVDRLKALGGAVVIVSPSGARPDGYLAAIPGPNRRDNLLAARELYPDRPLRVYIDDTEGNRTEAELAGFSFVFARDFRLA
jgi:hypothetical protein